ncbi:probable RNA helicase SDE3 [Magnolia sinica]|uniref:probable RNA helicase SDE3 n=1 Tax=Magnolia sinica TaxID=86752 RepID=UPI002658751A|nr:probable RNA helicase SDE3 [Magnolia sinica]
MLGFFQILRRIFYSEEVDGNERIRHHNEALARSSSPPRSHQRISQDTSNYCSSAPIIMSQPESIERPRVAPSKVFSSSSQSIQLRNSSDPTIDKLIGERDCRTQSLVSSARVGSDKESLAKQPGASSKLITPSSPSSFMSDPPKKPPGSPAMPDPPKKPAGLPLGASSKLITPSSPSFFMSDPPKKPPGPPAMPDPPQNPAGLPPMPDPLKKLPEQMSTLPIYEIPEHFKDLLEKDKVPPFLRKPLSPSTYKDYFAALIFAEDYYYEKWKDFCLDGVTLKLHEESTSNKSRKSNEIVFRIEESDEIESVQKEKKIYVAIEIDSIPAKRPYLLSRDFVFVKPSGKNVTAFKGSISRVVNSKHVLVEFGDDFHMQYSSTCEYDVGFSLNRVCLKRFHQAIEAAVDPSFGNFLFPDLVPRSRYLIPTPLNFTCLDLDLEQKSAIYQILNFRGPPYLVVKKSCYKTGKRRWSRTEEVICRAILYIYRSFKDSRILVTAPTNSTCDLVMMSLQGEISEEEMFRANAAFREIEDVPDYILPSTLYKGECFTCPPLIDLCEFKVITSTFVSSFRLCKAGINSGHFTHIFMVNASSAPEPEVMITLANLANEATAVVITGSSEDHPPWIRSDIARRYGLKRSYLERLLQSEPYSSRDPRFVSFL